MNFAMTGNPYENDNIVISSRGVMTDAKIAKLNNTTKRPVLVANWENGRPSIRVVPESVKETPTQNRDYDSLLNSIGIKACTYQKGVNNSGAKKLRVNRIVIAKTKTIYNAVNKEETVQEEKNDLVSQINALSMPTVEEKREDIHGRHEKTGEIPVNAVAEAIRNDTASTLVGSRMERNAQEHENVKEEAPRQEPKAGDIDLYNNLLHSGKVDDVSRQLQGAREELSYEKEESRKLAEQYGKAVRELEELKNDIESKRRMKAQQEKQELTETLNNIETLKRENLERTSDLSSIQAEIAKLKAEKEAMEGNFYQDNSYSFGRRAA